MNCSEPELICRDKTVAVLASDPTDNGVIETTFRCSAPTGSDKEMLLVPAAIASSSVGESSLRISLTRALNMRVVEGAVDSVTKDGLILKLRVITAMRMAVIDVANSTSTKVKPVVGERRRRIEGAVISGARPGLVCGR